jgi:hypothetical protein
VVRRGGLWYAVRPTTSGKHPDDIRADFGLIALKARGGDGRFRDVSHLRPFTRGGAVQSAGPVLRTGGVLGLPSATRLRVAGDGTVAMTVAWRGPPTPHKYAVAKLPSGKSVRALGYTPGPIRRGGVPLAFAPVPCGVRLSVGARAGDTIEYSVFLTRASARSGPRAVSDALSRTTFNRSARVSLEGPYFSPGSFARASPSRTSPPGRSRSRPARPSARKPPGRPSGHLARRWPARAIRFTADGSLGTPPKLPSGG